jgi:hypothetical protein
MTRSGRYPGTGPSVPSALTDSIIWSANIFARMRSDVSAAVFGVPCLLDFYHSDESSTSLEESRFLEFVKSAAFFAVERSHMRSEVVSEKLRQILPSSFDSSGIGFVPGSPSSRVVMMRPSPEKRGGAVWTALPVRPLDHYAFLTIRPESPHAEGTDPKSPWLTACRPPACPSPPVADSRSSWSIASRTAA